MDCTCDIPIGSDLFMEHEYRCPLFEPRLTQREIRHLRQTVLQHVEHAHMPVGDISGA